jgi:hypothetical protein
LRRHRFGTSPIEHTQTLETSYWNYIWIRLNNKSIHMWTHAQSNYLWCCPGALGGCSFSHSSHCDEFDFTTVVKLIEAVLLKDPFKSFSFLLMLSFLVFHLSCCITISVAHCHIKVALVTEILLSISVKPQQNIYWKPNSSKLKKILTTPYHS